MDAKILTELDQLKKQLDKLPSIRESFEEAKSKYSQAEKLTQQHRMSLEKLLDTGIKEVKTTFHKDLEKLIEEYKNFLSDKYKEDWSSKESATKELLTLSTEIKNLYEVHLSQLTLTTKEVIENRIDTLLAELKASISVDLKNASSQINVTSNLFQDAFRKNTNTFLDKLFNFTLDADVKSYIKQEISLSMKEFQEIAANAKRRDEKISKLIDSVEDLTQELKFLKQAKVRDNSEQDE